MGIKDIDLVTGELPSTYGRYVAVMARNGRDRSERLLVRLGSHLERSEEIIENLRSEHPNLTFTDIKISGVIQKVGAGYLLWRGTAMHDESIDVANAIRVARGAIVQTRTDTPEPSQKQLVLAE